MTQYLYELHTHTSQTSKCGHMPAARVIDVYHQHGYQGLAVTDHLHETYIDSLDCKDDWQQCVTRYMDGYYASRAQAEKYDMDAIFGIEIRFPENDRDYLVFGIDEDFLRRNPYLYRLGHEAFYEKFKDEVLILHAHPYRAFKKSEGDIYTDCIHGLEIINCNPRHDSDNARAFSLAKQYKNLIRVAGSDAHQEDDPARSALLFDHRIRDSFAFKAALESGNFRLSCEAFHDIILQNEKDLEANK